MSRSFSKLRRIIIYLTRRCNLKCKHCWINPRDISSSEYELQTPEIINVINEALDLGLEQIGITGGEPFLRRKVLYEVLKYSREMDIPVVIETNGTLLTRPDISFLKRMNVYIAISLDSSDENFHDSFRGERGAFKRTLLALKTLTNENIPCEVIMTVTKGNLNNINKLAELVLDRIGVDALKVDPVIAVGRAKYLLDELLDVNSMHIFIEKVKELTLEYPGKIFTSVPPALLGRSILEKNSRITAPCDYRHICGLLPNGDISLCGIGLTHRELVFGNVQQKTLKSILSDANELRLLREARPQDFKGVCSLCIFSKYCANYCPAYSYEIYGDLLASNPICQAFYDSHVFPSKYLKVRK